MLVNFRTAILCGAYCLCACSMSLNAQTIDVNLSGSFGANAQPTTGDNLRPFAGRESLFTSTLSEDGLTSQNELNAPITVDVFEDTGALQLSIDNATSVSGVDGPGGPNTDNRASFNVSGLGLNIESPNRRINPELSSDVEGNNLAESGFRLDGQNQEFLTLSFNQDVIVSAIGLTNLTAGETFQFFDQIVAADSISSVSNDSNGFDADLDVIFFDVPLEIAAGESILVGALEFDIDTLSTANTGVGFEVIRLEVVGPPPVVGGGGTPAVPEPSSLALLGLGGLLVAGRRRRG